MNREAKIRRIKEFGIIFLFFILLAICWWVIFKVTQTAPPADESEPMSFEIRGRAPIPYFILAVDRSGSMKETDPENYEIESLKQIIRLIYFNSQQLKKVTGHYPMFRLVSFSGSPRPITDQDKWYQLTSESDVEHIDNRLNEFLKDRNGQFTDINTVVEYAINAYENTPSQVGQGEEARPTSVIVILFTDGGIYPNFLNRINHKPGTKNWENFSIRVKQMADQILGDSSGAKILAVLDQSTWVDPIDWSFDNLPHDRAVRFKSQYYSFNDSFYQNPSYFIYAKDQVQKLLHDKLLTLNDPAFRFNVIALLKTENGNTKNISQMNSAKEYLRKWSSKLGFFYHVQDASALGDVFIDIMSDYLNTYSESFALSGTRQIGPFSRDVAEAQVVIVFPKIIDKEKQDEMIHLYAPSGNSVQPSLNSTFEHSRSYFLSKDQFPDFHDEKGWKLEFIPATINGEIVEHAKCTLITIHDYVLDVQPDTEFNKKQTHKTRYIIRLVGLKNRQAIPLENFEELMDFEAKALDRSKALPDVNFSPNYEENGINADFVEWPSGIYTIQFRMTKGQLKADNSPLRGKSITTEIAVGERIWFYNPDGEEISNLNFEQLDQK